MSIEPVLAGVIVMSLTFYALSGGADYGAGIWYLLSCGRCESQRRLITSALSPIWETNHVWLILAVTVLFTAFPKAFGVIATVLHIPLTVLLVGVVLRGSAFAFRTSDVKRDRAHLLWDWVFAGSSFVTPFLLGITIGAIASGRTRLREGTFLETFIAPWFAPFPFAVGLLTVSLFAFLAAVYLTMETDEPALRDDFRRRALIAGIVVVLLSNIVVILAASGAPQLYRDVTESAGMGPLLAVSGVSTGASLLALWRRKYVLARVAAATVTIVMIWGWAWSQFPYVIEPDLTIYEAAAPPVILKTLLGILLLGACLVMPSIYYLFRVFKGGIINVTAR